MHFNAGCNEQSFLLNPEKKLVQIRLAVFEKNAKTTYTLIPKNDVTEPKTRLL